MSKMRPSCKEQFEDRIALASCLITNSEERDGGVVSMVVEAFYYRARTSKDSDGYMRDCLKSGGKWTAAATDDPEAARERLRQRAKNLQDIAGKAGQMQ